MQVYTVFIFAIFSLIFHGCSSSMNPDKAHNRNYIESYFRNADNSLGFEIGKLFRENNKNFTNEKALFQGNLICSKLRIGENGLVDLLDQYVAASGAIQIADALMIHTAQYKICPETLRIVQVRFDRKPETLSIHIKSETVDLSSSFTIKEILQNNQKPIKPIPGATEI